MSKYWEPWHFIWVIFPWWSAWRSVCIRNKTDAISVEGGTKRFRQWKAEWWTPDGRSRPSAGRKIHPTLSIRSHFDVSSAIYLLRQRVESKIHPNDRLIGIIHSQSMMLSGDQIFWLFVEAHGDHLSSRNGCWILLKKMHCNVSFIV